MTPATTWLVALSAVVVLLALALLIASRRASSPGDDSESDEPGRGDGGSKRNPPPSSPTRPDGVDPPWWAEFEREFAAYAARQRVPPSGASHGG
jgi:hypothetical protein